MKPPRGLSPEEKEQWSRIARTVKPIPKRAVSSSTPSAALPTLAKKLPPIRRVEPMISEEWTVGSKVAGAKSRTATKIISTGHAHPMVPGAASLDGGWDRRFRRGAVRPDRSIDLHGYTLDQAHGVLERELTAALLDDVRVLLVITGKEPKEQTGGYSGRGEYYSGYGASGRRRGVIRASIADWLAHSRHAPMIAAVRNAHPRDGGSGALYVILRRKR